MIVMQEQS